MIVATDSLLEPLELWARAIRMGDLSSARRCAERLNVAGELLVIRPEFRHIFEEHCPGHDPRDALEMMSQLLFCAAEGRAKELAQRSNGTPPVRP